MARDVNGQLIYISPEHNMIAVKFSSWPEFSNVVYTSNTISALHAIANKIRG